MRFHSGLLVASAGLAAANPTPRDLRTALPNSALAIEHKYQPVLDFDRDGCYYTAAIDAAGNLNPGLNAAHGVPPTCLQSQCRDPSRLQNSNVYSRSRCNNGWCAIMYEYYFEKDQNVCGSFAQIDGKGGHRHDWENIVVFVHNDEFRRVAVSAHGGYLASSAPLLQDGTRAKVVYHKDGGKNHCFRMGSDADDKGIENYTGQWFLGTLVGWTGWPSVELREKAMNWAGGIQPKLTDAHFAEYLRKAAGDQVPGFNPDVDG